MIPHFYIWIYCNSTGDVQPLRDVSHPILSSQESTPAQSCLRCRAHVSQLLGEIFLYIPIHILHWLCRMHNHYKFSMCTCSFRISDALVAANSSKCLKFQGKDSVELCMDETIRDMDAYIKLTDSVLDRILHPPALSDESLEKVMMQIHNFVFTVKYFCIPNLIWHCACCLQFTPIPFYS